MKIVIAALLLGIIAVVGVAIASTSQDVSGLAAAADDGSALYGKKCRSCHGKDGRGNAMLAEKLKVDPAALDLVDEASLAKSDEELIRITAEGEGKMPGYAKKLTAEEIEGTIAHVRSLAG